MGLLYMFTLYSGAVSLVMDLLFSSPRQFPLHRVARKRFVVSILSGLYLGLEFGRGLSGLYYNTW